MVLITLTSTIWINIVVGVTVAYVASAIVSFLMLLGMRLPRGENWISKSSRCETCDRKLGFIDLAPIFSYVLLRGKCRGCGTRYGSEYFNFELGTFILTFMLYMYVGLNWVFLFSILGWFLIVPYLIMTKHYSVKESENYVRVVGMLWMLYVMVLLMFMMVVTYS